MFEAVQAQARFAARVTPAPAERAVHRGARVIAIRARGARTLRGRGR